jgi:hypothetical protein
MVDPAFLEAPPRSRHPFLHIDYSKYSKRCLARFKRSPARFSTVVELRVRAALECYRAAMTTPHTEQLPRHRERLAELEGRWSPSILDLTHDDAMRWHRTGKEIFELRRRIEAGEKQEE